MREAVARENEITLYRSYGEEQAAASLGIDVSTLKKWRRDGKVPFVNMGQRKVRYLGFMVCDVLLGLFDGKVSKD